MPQTPGRIERGGDRSLADGLAEALLDAGRDREFADSLTHPFHTYPARMHPGTARRLVELCAPGRGSVILDPFCGSGTTLVEARAAGLAAIGIDLNPLAAAIAHAKTWTVVQERRALLREAGHQIAGEALASGKQARRSGGESAPLRAPAGFDPNARNRRLLHWFSPHVRRELEHMASSIDAIAERDPDLASVLRISLSAILYKVSRRTSDTDPTPIDKNIARGMAARIFAQRIDLLCAGLVDLTRSPPAPQPIVHNADARDLAALGIAPASVNAVVTSPPYVGTYDYADQQRLRFDFFGIRHRDFDDNEMGARRGFEGDEVAQRAALRQWQRDFTTVLTSLSVALQPGGRIALVVGDSIVGARAHLADQDVRTAAGDLYDVTAWAWQERLKLGTFERRAFGPDLKREHIILLTKR